MRSAKLYICTVLRKSILAATIKNIIFDLGGVILNIDYHLTIQAFTELGIPNFKEKYSQAQQNHLFDRLDTGTISGTDFVAEIKREALNGITEKDILRCWNAMLLDLPKERLELLEKLGENYRLFLLSNTNEIHIPEYNKLLERTFGFKDLAHLFEKQYYSFEIGLRKPDIEIFEFVLSENGLLAEETLFIDDSKQHIKGAEKTGINTYWLKPNETIIDVFPTILNP